MKNGGGLISIEQKEDMLREREEDQREYRLKLSNRASFLLSLLRMWS